ncbi:glycosyltransferase family 2 protein [Mycobacterium sp. MS1601]|uniref:glycosyltransferase family 2 protein n=1 Tax=Mycobacterium sp. MS1601 TaxID=1936029 RepID=UPI001F3DF330|nr:glycosyltransferase [Mycobacterium sp. MS1601]
MPEPTSVVAAIPNYNMGQSLQRLLPQVLNQGYDRVLVLDDASTDTSVDVVAGFGGAVEMVRSPVNQGAGANRNQVLGQVEDSDLIHFIDADMDLATEHIGSLARDLYTRYAAQGVGAVGGLVSRADGSQEPFNFGPVFSLKTVMASAPPMLDRIRDKPRLVRAIRRIGVPGQQYWPDVFETPVARPAYWLHEGNMLINAGVFGAVGGYDTKVRYHEAQDLGIRLERLGVKRQFDPQIAVVHHYIDVRGKSRSKQERDSVLYLIRKHGVARFLTER